MSVIMASAGDSKLSQQSRAPNLAFGPFEFDPVTAELRKHGYRVKLPAQPGEILSALVKRPGELVTREDLRSLLWPGVSAGDFEHGVNAAVNKLRQALGDAANQPRYIETFPGRGYRFLAPVYPVRGGVLELVPPAAISVGEPRQSRRRLVAWASAAAILALLAGALWIALRPSPAASLKATQFQITPPQGYYFEGGGPRQSFALSPDGERIAFTAKDQSGSFRLFLRDFSELESRPVAGGEGAYSVVWSPDGRTLLFTAKGKLRRMEANAAANQILSDGPSYFTSAIPFGPNRILVSSLRSSGVMDSSGGTLRPIDRVYSWAQILPGGQDFLYTVDDDPSHGALHARIAPVGGNESGVDVVQADSRVQYTDSLRSHGGYLVYLRAGTLLAQPFDLAARRVTAEPRAIVRQVPSFGHTGAADFSVSRSSMLAYQSYVARSQFIWVDRTGKRLSAASPAEISASYARLSPDGRWLAAVPFDIERGVPEIWLYDAVTGAGRKVIYGPGIRHIPVWSPDSRRLVYLLDQSWPKLALSSVDGEPDKEPMPDTGFMAPTDWSPDGRFILYNNSALPAVTQVFPSDVFAVDMARNRKVIPLLTSPFFENNAVFSPDGKWLAFLSNESGHSEIYLQELDRSNDSLRVTGERFLISHQGAQCLRWRKDGKELYYLGSDGQIYAVSLNFSRAGVRAGNPDPLFRLDAEARSTVHSVVSFDVSADGRRFVIPSVTLGESSALVVLRDWESLVAK
jgi:Tol biopolymer transport system component/DNA-binding winged helix-turn-helix (wHTH) protein